MEVAFWSSIGQTIERFFLVEAFVDLGCCSNNAAISLPVIINTLQVNDEVGDGGDFRNGEYFHEEASVVQLDPYIYSPKKGIVYLNE